MPLAPIGFCPSKGCHVRSHGPCPEHTKQQQQAYDDRRGTSASRGYDRRWARWRAQVIRDHRLIWCGDRPESAPDTDDSHCKGQQVTLLGKELDHIQPITGPDDPRLFDESNVQLLCSTCHAIKLSAESRLYG